MKNYRIDRQYDNNMLPNLQLLGHIKNLYFKFMKDGTDTGNSWRVDRDFTSSWVQLSGEKLGLVFFNFFSENNISAPKCY